MVTGAKTILAKINSVIIFPVIIFLMALATLVFLYGAFEFVLKSDNPVEREVGKRHMLYGLFGMLVMISAMTILSIAAGTFGLSVSN